MGIFLANKYFWFICCVQKWLQKRLCFDEKYWSSVYQHHRLKTNKVLYSVTLAHVKTNISCEFEIIKNFWSSYKLFLSYANFCESLQITSKQHFRAFATHGHPKSTQRLQDGYISQDVANTWETFDFMMLKTSIHWQKIKHIFKVYLFDYHANHKRDILYHVRSNIRVKLTITSGKLKKLINTLMEPFKSLLASLLSYLWRMDFQTSLHITKTQRSGLLRKT